MKNKDLDDREIEMMLKYVPEYTEETAKNIKDKFTEKSKGKQRKIPFKRLVLSGVAASMVFATTLAYAGIIDISKVYKTIFGENSKYVEKYIQPLDKQSNIKPILKDSDKENPSLIQSEYDGIVIKLISAINDEDSLLIFATATDTKGDRLGEDLDFTSWGLSQGNGGNLSVVDYNNETKTATLMITSLGNNHKGKATLNINGFSTGREFLENLPEKNIKIDELIKGHKPEIITQDEVWKSGGGGNNQDIYENSRLLKNDEMDIKFDNVDMFSIANMGFVDGLFHIQMKAGLSGVSLIDGYYISAKIVNSENEIVYDPSSSISFTPDKKYAYEKHSKEPHNKYREIIYEDITSPDQLNGLSLTIDYMKSPKITEGTWEFSFMIPEKVTTDFKVDREININGEKLKIDMVSLSPIGITVHLKQKMSSDYSHKDKVSVEYIDGTTILLDQSSIHTYEDESTLTFRGDIIEIEKVQSILINGEKISIIP